MSIAVLDFGGQYTHLVAQRIRKLHVHSQIISPTTPNKELVKYAGLVLSGGPHSVTAIDAPNYNSQLFDLGIPILGICYGHQLVCQHFNSKIVSSESTEYGPATLHRSQYPTHILQGLDSSSQVWMSHGDSVQQLGPQLVAVARTANCPTAVIEHCYRRIYGVQFHPEVRHTEQGLQVLRNFIKICDCSTLEWSVENYLETLLNDIRQQCQPDKNVFMLLSGGVDSTVAFTLLNRALGPDRVYGLHIDNGFMRLHESRQVKAALRQVGITNFKVIDARSKFYQALRCASFITVLKEPVTTPQIKRKIIGDLFIDVQQQETALLDTSRQWLLGQGTIYPDTIESGGTSNSQVIKTHHNRVERIQEMIEQGLVIEPLANLYKDEVRELGELLGLPRELVWRHPFPGPGLAIRILCAAKNRTSNVVDGLTVLPVRSVGVQGDQRSYASPAVLYDDDDPKWEQLAARSTEITNKYVGKINRVIYNLVGLRSNKWYTSIVSLSFERIKVLQEIDDLVTRFLREHPSAEPRLYDSVWQCPVVLIPCSPIVGKESIVLRPVESTEAMTANFARLPLNLMQELAQQILTAAPTITNVLYDITNKPPGTIEWE